jgi:beta-glucosidase
MTKRKSDAAAAVERLTVGQQVDLGVGKDFWHTRSYSEQGIPSLTMSDGPSGLRYQGASSNASSVNDAALATCYPSSATVAASWDSDLAYEVGSCIGQEARAAGVGVVLGPGLNIKRSPLGGRNFEYYSEDPLLTAVMGTGFVEGVQSTGVGACVKHFALNSQEYKRFSNDANADERTMREIYLAAFERVVMHAHPQMLMCAYNKINGSYCSDNAWLLRQVLREEWGFKGVVVTDWGAMHDRVAAYKATCDLAMPGGSHHQQRRALEAIKAGLLSSEELVASAKRLARLAIRQEGVLTGVPSANLERCHAVALKAAREGMVLLSNKAVLPLKPTDKIALIGHMAADPRYQGAGSSHVNCRGVSTLRELEPNWSYAAGYEKDGSTNDELIAAAVHVAKLSDVAVMVIGLPEAYESEGFDRNDMALPDAMVQLVKAVASVAAHSVVVLLGGAPMELPFADDVDSLIWAGLGGEACGEALDELLCGTINPSGKLAESWPIRYEDAACSAYWGKPHRDAQFREGLYVGYRYYESANVPVRFCFGHGLSYTTFSYTDLVVAKDGSSVKLTITNIGTLAGTEVVQVYIEPPKEGLYRPRRILGGFARVNLLAGEAKLVTISIDPRAYQLWDSGWKTISGSYGVAVGSSVQDIRLRSSVEVQGEQAICPIWQKNSWYEFPSGLPPQDDFERMLGRRVAERTEQRGSYTNENTLVELSQTCGLARFMVWLISRSALKSTGGDPKDPAYLMSVAASADNTLFGLVNISAGAMPEWLAHLVLYLANRY